MKKYLLLLTVLFALISSTINAAIIPVEPSQPATVFPSLPARFATMSMNDIQKLVGRKLTVKEKIGVKVLQWKMKKQLRREKAGEPSNTGKLAYIFALVALGSLVLMLFVPTFFFFTGLMALLALIFGSKGKREDPGDRKSKFAFTVGWVILAVLLAFIIAVLIAFSNSSWSFG